MNDVSQKACLNCGFLLNHDDHYCPSCGQSIKASRLSLLEIIKDSLSNIFNLDTRIAHTLMHIFLPSKLAKAYVEGRRKYYVNPIRLFLFFIVTCISIVLFNDVFDETKSISQQLVKDAEDIKLHRLFDTLSFQYKTEQNAVVFDTLESQLFEDYRAIRSPYIGNNIKIFGTDFSQYKITKEDVVNLSPDEIIEKYKVTGWFQQLEVKQLVRFITDTSAGIKYAVKNLTWIITILVFFSAFSMKIIYIRHGYYYVEHLVLILYGHAFALFMTLPILLTLGSSSDVRESAWLVFSILVPIVQFMSIKRYYGQGVFKTLLKMFVFNISYLVSGLVIAIIVTLISFALF